MQTGESRGTTGELARRVADFKFALAVREAEFKRREEALKQAERALALPRVSSEYFDAGHYAAEDEWWSKQLGAARTA